MTKQLANWSPYHNNGGSCFAIAGADYCVIAADFTRDHTKISKLSQKSVMASGGFQADDLKALQEFLSAENLKYEGQHNKPMSCPEMRYPLCCHLWERRPNYGFIVLGGLDSEGKGRVFTLFGADIVASGVRCSSQYSGSRQIEAPIFKYELPTRDDVAQLSETEAVDLAEKLFASSTHTGHKLEIDVLNASGLHPKHVDLRKDRDRCYGQVLAVAE